MVLGSAAWRDGLRAAFALAAMPVALASLLAVAADARAAMYKWVDEKGVVHYSDQVPPDALNKNRTELNAQGVPIKKTDKAPTPEQVRAKEQEEARARQIDKQQEEIARRDRALVASYTTEKDIDLARNRALQTIEAVIQSAEAYAAQLKTRGTDAGRRRPARTAGFSHLPAVSPRQPAHQQPDPARGIPGKNIR